MFYANVKFCNLCFSDKLSQQYDEKKHKPGCTATEDSSSLEILYAGSAGNVLSMLRKHSQ